MCWVGSALRGCVTDVEELHKEHLFHLWSLAEPWPCSSSGGKHWIWVNQVSCLVRIAWHRQHMEMGQIRAGQAICGSVGSPCCLLVRVGHTSLLPNPHTCSSFKASWVHLLPALKEHVAAHHHCLTSKAASSLESLIFISIHPLSPCSHCNQLKPRSFQSLSTVVSVGPVTINAGVQRWTRMELRLLSAVLQSGGQRHIKPVY